MTNNESNKAESEIKDSDLARISIDISDLTKHSQKILLETLDRCIRCNTCKYAFGPCTPSCPAGENFKWESYWASGKIRIARALLTGKLSLDDEDIIEPIFACPTCGACTDNCQAPHNERIVDIIEALRELIVKKVKAPIKQAKLLDLIKNFNNPYGVENSTNEDLKKHHALPDKAEIVYFIGCTSNYRQKDLRDATLSVFKKLNLDFTLVDEYCCGSPIIRTGQLDDVPRIMSHNIDEFKRVGAKIIVTSCAGCYRTLKKDFQKFNNEINLEILHTSEFLLSKKYGNILSNGIKRDSNIEEKLVTYHDPCHLGHHLGLFEPPRKIINSIPNTKLKEMKRNRLNSWCCGAGGGVKIGFPDWALNISKERVEEAKETGSKILISTCPFCKTNLTDANEKFEIGLEIVDLIELLDKVL